MNLGYCYRMRCLLVLVALVATASADTPPSKTLERAIKLYDKQDFYSSLIELKKVIDGDSGDDAKNKQRAEFFVGKALYQTKYYAVSHAYFDKIAAAGAAHVYNTASIKWFAALARVLPMEMEVLGRYSLNEFADPSLDSVRAEATYLHARVLFQRADYAKAAAALATIDKSSPFYQPGRLLLAFTHIRTSKTADALAVLATIPAGDDTGDLALIAAASVGSKGALDKVRPAGLLGARASWDRAVSIPKAYGTSPVVGPDAPEPAPLQVLATYEFCGKRTAVEVVGRVRANSAEIQKELGKLLALDDNADFYDAFRKALKQPQTRIGAYARAVLAAPSVGRAFAFVDELDAELALLRASDKAFQTTQIAAEMLQELTVLKSVAAADAGKIAHDRIDRLAKAVPEIAKLSTRLDVGTQGGPTVVCP
jgi:thioredoxin-like negative regulator of GroEL